MLGTFLYNAVKANTPESGVRALTGEYARRTAGGNCEGLSDEIEL